MLDTLKLEEKGIPAVALIHDRFAVAARNLAKLRGLASAKVVVIPEPYPGTPDAELAPRIDPLWDEIVGALVKA